MAITRVSANSAAGTTATIGAHQAGDLILVHAYRDGSNSAPGSPIDFSSIDTSGGANTNGSRIAFKWAQSGSESTGTWLNATGVNVMVYRGVTAIGASSVGSGSGNTITYPALTLREAGGTSWVVRFAGHRTATNITANTPAGFTAVTGVAAESRTCDSNGAVSSNPGTATQSVDASSGWIARTLELRSDIGIPAETFIDGFDGGTSIPDSSKWEIISGSGLTVNTSTHELAVAGTFPASDMRSIAVLDLTDNAVVFGPVSAITGGSGSFSKFFLYVGHHKELFWELNALSGAALPGLLSSAGPSRTHSPGDWYRIRGASGVVYFEYSSDAATWSVQHSAAYYGPVSALGLRFEAGALSGSFSVTIGGVNELPASGSVLKYHDGSVWKHGALKRHDGTNWVPSQLRAFDGADWR